MIDLTTKKEDKDKFITKVYINDDSPLYFVKYASGRIAPYELSLHNLNATLLTMEEQFNSFKDDYIEKLAKACLRSSLSQLIEGVIAIGTICFTTTLPIPVPLKALLILVALIYSIYHQKSEHVKQETCVASGRTIQVAEEFLRDKDRFKTTITDPVTNEPADWYLVTLSEIEAFSNPQELNLIAAALTPEIKKEEGANATMQLKKLFQKGDDPIC